MILKTKNTIREIMSLVASIDKQCGELIDLTRSLTSEMRTYKNFPHHAHTKEFLISFAKDRRIEGYSIRQIMKMMGYKSPRSVQDLLPHKMKGEHSSS